MLVWADLSGRFSPLRSAPAQMIFFNTRSPLHSRSCRFPPAPLRFPLRSRSAHMLWSRESRVETDLLSISPTPCQYNYCYYRPTLLARADLSFKRSYYCQQSMWAERERSGKRSGAGAKRHERERSGERVLKKIIWAGAERSGLNRPLKSAHTNIAYCILHKYFISRCSLQKSETRFC